MENEITDTDRLNFLQSQLGTYSGKVVCRDSSTGRGWRLHETSRGDFYDVREAIDDYIKQKRLESEDQAG